MTNTLTRVTDEFRRMDDELAAAVILPAVDAVIRRAGTANRASTAAAAAVLTVGALGGITAVAQAGPSSNVAAELPAPGITVLPTPTSTEPVITSEATGSGPAVDSAVPRQRVQVAPPPAAAPAVVPTPEAAPPVVETPDDDNGDTEGKPDPTKTNKPTKTNRPTTTAPTTKPTTTAPTTTADPQPTTSAAGTTTGSTDPATPSA